MQDAPIVGIGDRIAQLAEYASRCFERKLVRLQTPYQRSERLAIEQFHGDEIRSVVVVEVENVHDPRVGEQLRRVVLAAQRIHCIRAARVLLAQDLERHVLVLRRQTGPVEVERTIDDAAPPRPISFCRM